MARFESIAIAGYYPTPPDVVQRLIARFHPPSAEDLYRRNIFFLDPCAGEGAVIAQFQQAHRQLQVAGVEMEETRYKICCSQGFNRSIIHGDFFRVKIEAGSMGLLWLNPPYDYDKECGRLEERFLRKALHTLASHGILFFLVPGYALTASADTLATHFTDLSCFRFPDESYGDYKQVVVIARRSPHGLLDTQVRNQVLAWAAHPETLEILPAEPSPSMSWPMVGGYSKMELMPVDLDVLKKQFHPWVSDRGLIRDINPPLDLAGQYNRTYPVASTPRATHLASALAAGVFNGARVTPNKHAERLPPLLVKGVFEKDYRTVEEKLNKEGAKVAEVQVQHPVLRVTVLNLNTGEFHIVKPSSEMPLVESLEGMTLANLLDCYGDSLMERMREACPVLHDPVRGDVEIEPRLAQPLFPAQKTVVNTILRMKREQNADGGIVLGEIGSGKTRVALAIAQELNASHTVVLCPPHLLDSWKDEAAAVLPGHNTVVLDTIPEIDRFFASSGSNIGILSRERAKLSHGWESVSGACPKCGVAIPDVDYAAKRSRCDTKTYKPHNEIAKWVAKNQSYLSKFIPTNSLLLRFAHETPAQARIQQKREDRPETWRGVMPDITPLLSLLKAVPDIALWLAWAAPATAIPLANNVDFNNYQWGQTWSSLLLSVDIHTPLPALPEAGVAAYYKPSLKDLELKRLELWADGPRSNDYSWRNYLDGKLEDVPFCSAQALQKFLNALAPHCTIKSYSCNEPLYQAVPEPNRYPLASWICRKHRDAYQVLVVDEAHEYSSEDSAQSHAKERLEAGSAFRLLLTGSLANGYADSVFNNLFSVSKKFRETFGREGRFQFVDRYGYWKRIIQEKDTKGTVITFGSQSDRVQRSSKKGGISPGVLPLFNLEWLLPCAATLQKTDLHLGLPEPVHSTHPIPMGKDLTDNYNSLLDTLLETIKQTRFEEGKSGKLWGALAHLPSYLDLAACGTYEIRWPENTPEVGGQIIASVPGSDPSVLLPKEQWLIENVTREVALGRPVLVLGWHRLVLERLTTILKSNGFPEALYLDAAQVPTGKRQAWINKNVLKTNCQVMVVNPVAIQTGLNNLVHFKTQVWMENPGCSPHIFRQAQGRIDRVGQTKTPSFQFPLYEGSAQQQAHRLLLHKVGVALGVDGLDPEAALQAAGIDDEGFAGLSVGRALYRMLVGD